MTVSYEFQPLKSGDYTVILYHGVYDDSLILDGRNSSGKHISKSEFLHQMRILKEKWNVVTMDDISLAHRGLLNLPDRAVAVTIDDGFANTYYHAWPILKELKIPATYYLATGLVGTGKMGWTDQLESLFMDGRSGSLRVEVNDSTYMYCITDKKSRIESLVHLKTICKKLPFSKVEVVLDQIKSDLNAEPDSEHALYEMLNWDQVREMSNEGTFEFGSHTVDHIPLSRMPYDQMVLQVNESINMISTELDIKCRKFSYPEGQKDDFDDKSIEFLKSIGIDHCPTAIQGKNSVATTDPFHIRRCMIGFEGRPFILN